VLSPLTCASLQDPGVPLSDGSYAVFDCSGCSLCSVGCTDPTASNYDETATYDNGSCIPAVYGCMDTLDDNYNFEANVNDPESCIGSSC
jgi:hypothetical protein